MYDFSDKGFENIIVKEDDERIEIRSNAKSKEEALQWKAIYCQRFHCSFNVMHNYNVVKGLFHVRYCCLFGDQRHKGIRKTNTSCCVTMNIKVKRITKDTIKKDKLILTHPCFIMIKGKHNHSTETGIAVEQLRVLPETREEFLKYFEAGMTPSKAIKHHQEILDSNLASFANNDINPGPKSVYYWYSLWQKLKDSYGSVGAPLEDNNVGAPLEVGSDYTPLENGSDGAPLEDCSDGALLEVGSDGAPLKDGSVGAPLEDGSVGAPLEDKEGAFTYLDYECPMTFCSVEAKGFVSDSESSFADVEDVYETLKEVCNNFRDDETSRALGTMVKRLRSIKSSRQLNSSVSSFGLSVVRSRGKYQKRKNSGVAEGSN